MNPVHAAWLASILAVCLATGPAAAQKSTAFTIGPVVARGDDSDRLLLGLGAFNVIAGRGSNVISAAGEVQYRFGWKLPVLGSFLGPLIGAMGNTDGGAQGYGGVYADFVYRRWVVSPFGAVGAYRQGDSKDLGGVLSFRIGLDAGYELDSGARIGVRFAHISNAFTHDDNPGEEEVMLTYSIPLFASRR